ncbi:hypothetical protein [Sphingomonas rhizophila]|nr:hypothetical protein [Sphingomonas rhizophila]
MRFSAKKLIGEHRIRRGWRIFPPKVGTDYQPGAGELATLLGLSCRTPFFRKGQSMLAKILGALAGEKIAGRNNKAAGALIGAAVPMIARRGLGPLSLALGAGWAAKKIYDRRRDRRTGQASA